MTENTLSTAGLISLRREMEYRLAFAASRGDGDSMADQVVSLIDALEADRTEREALAAILTDVRQYADQVDPSNLDESPLWPIEVRRILSKLPADALAAVKETVWDHVLDENEINTAQAREGNPDRIEREAKR